MRTARLFGAIALPLLCAARICLSAETAGATRPSPTAVAAASGRWWPIQSMPRAIVRLRPTSPSRLRSAYEMTAQSVAGLTAKAVNGSRSDELVWIETGNSDLESRLASRLKQHSQSETQVDDLWQLVERYAKSGVVKGYILYRADTSTGTYNEHRPGIDCSVNVATSLAGILEGILVEEALEHEARARGLAKLFDARGKSQKWCFDAYRNRFNRRLVCTQDPRKPHARDLAIAHSAFTMYGGDEPLSDVMKWLEPLSPIVGWNGGDEFKTTELSSRYGHLQTATDWCMNLPVLMAGSERMRQAKLPDFDPRTIDWNDERSAVAFVSTDGDNVQWLQGNFFGAGEGASYWGYRERGRIPFGWSCCFAHLAQLCPETIEYAVATRSRNDSFIEWGGGYYYPDLFAQDRPNRWELVAQHARRTWEMMKLNNTRIIGFNVARYDSPHARRAYEVFARQTDGLLAILVFQYAPYEAGAGQTFWVKDRNGIEVPVISARYSIWEHANDRPRGGTPAKVAHDIVRTIDSTPKETLPRYDWVIAHVWSYFQQAPGPDEKAEEIDQKEAVAAGGVRGYSPVVWCAERLPAEIRVIGPEELAWRIRMQHNPSQTKQDMRKFKTSQ